MILLKQRAQTYQEVFPEYLYPAGIFPPLRAPIALTQKHWQNTRYLELGGLNI